MSTPFLPRRLPGPLTALLLSLAMSTAAPAIAAPPPPPEPPEPPAYPEPKDIDLEAAEQRRAAHFMEADRNADALLSQEEFVAAALTRAEARKGQRPLRRPGAQRGSGDRQERAVRQEAALFERLDRDDNGQLSQDEVAPELRRQARWELRAEQRFERLDQDADGNLTEDEYRAPLARLAAADADGDGVVTAEERRAAHRARREDPTLRSARSSRS